MTLLIMLMMVEISMPMFRMETDMNLLDRASSKIIPHLSITKILIFRNTIEKEKSYLAEAV